MNVKSMLLSACLLLVGATAKVSAQSSLSDTMLEELADFDISMSETAADNLTTGQWYVMYDRGEKRGYVYENVSTHKLLNWSTLPSGDTSSACKWLVRLQDAGNGKYYIQTGYGNYFGQIAHRTNVPTTAQPEESMTVEKIASTDGHFYVQCLSTNVILNANDFSAGESRATVVGWNTTVPTSTGGNDDFAFYPVSLVAVDPSVAFKADGITVTRGYQTAGRGNENTLLLRIAATAIKKATDVTLNVTLTDEAAENISSLYVYENSNLEFIATTQAAPLAAAEVKGENVALNIGQVNAGTHTYWLCATVKGDATLGAMLGNSLASLTYTVGETTTTLPLGSVGNPDRQAPKVFALQNFVFRPTTANCRYYRIPAMILDKNGDIVVAIDKRYNSNSDLGNHKIDVVSVRSTDGGCTWTNPVKVATGDGSTAAGYGYGDAALAMAPNGNLICVMAAGSTMFGYGMVNAGISTSKDNGETWSTVRSLFGSHFTDGVSGKTNSHDFTNFFTTSGKGLTTKDGTIMYATNARTADKGNTNLCYILYSTDNGENWTIGSELAYSGTDESKLEQMNDGSLLLSVRQSGNRGWNRANADATGWGSQYRTSDISGNACNADMLYYSRSTEGEPDIMLHSFINTSDRQSLQLAMSIDGGNSWTGVYNIQPNGSCYSTMVKLADGTLALLYEDESYSAGNGYAINYVTITKEQILAWYRELRSTLIPSETEVKIVYGTKGEESFGNWDSSSKTLWTSKAASGCVGLTLTKSSGTFDRYSNWNSRYNLAYKASVAGADATFTLKAPTGYAIKGYSLEARNYSAGSTKLTSENGVSVVTTTTAYKTLLVDELNTESTKITVNAQTSTNYLAMSNFVVSLSPNLTQTMMSVGDESYSAVYLPYGATLSDDVQAYKVTKVDGQYVYAVCIGKEVPAETPVILRSESGVSETTLIINTKAVADTEGNLLYGTPFAQHVDGYVLRKGDSEPGFYPIAVNSKLGINRAYLPATAVPDGTEMLYVKWEGTDGVISTYDKGQNEAGNTIYDLSGRPVDSPQKGIYVRGGKKFVRK